MSGGAGAPHSAMLLLFKDPVARDPWGKVLCLDQLMGGCEMQLESSGRTFRSLSTVRPTFPDEGPSLCTSSTSPCRKWECLLPTENSFSENSKHTHRIRLVCPGNELTAFLGARAGRGADMTLLLSPSSKGSKTVRGGGREVLLPPTSVRKSKKHATC